MSDERGGIDAGMTSGTSQGGKLKNRIPFLSGPLRVCLWPPGGIQLATGSSLHIGALIAHRSHRSSLTGSN